MIGSRRFEESIAVSNSSSCLPQHDLSGCQLPRACGTNLPQDRGFHVYFVPLDNINRRYLEHTVRCTSKHLMVSVSQSSSTFSKTSTSKMASTFASRALYVSKDERTAGMIRP
jgi:hypothetical protein